MSSPHEVQSVVRRFLRDALVSSIESGGRVVPLQIQFVLNRRRFWETPFVIRNGHRPGWHLRATERDMAQAPPVLDADLWPPRRDPARDAPGIRMEVTPGHADSFSLLLAEAAGLQAHSPPATGMEGACSLTLADWRAARNAVSGPRSAPAGRKGNFPLPTP